VVAKFTTPNINDDAWATIDRLLHLARTHLGMDVACLTQFEDDQQVVRAINGRTSIPVGAGMPHSESYCVRVLAGTIPAVITDARRQPVTRELTITRLLGAGSYIGVPWQGPDGEPAGMLCCTSGQPTPGLDDQNVRYLDLIAELISDHVTKPAPGAPPGSGQAALALRDILATRAADMVFQPVVRLNDGSTIGFEALARFDPTKFPTPTHAFAAATQAGLGVDLEHLAVQRALEHLDDIPDDNWLCVNLSVEALLSPAVEATLMAHTHRQLGIEVTEHTQVSDYPALLTVTERLRAAGMKIVVDDAGAGFASLSHILQLRPDVIKLDITLTRGIDTDQVRMALTRSLVSFAGDIDALLIAEGVETRSEHEKLRELGVRLGQGFYMAPPGALVKHRFPLPA
jgi:EAL domain-containing protein (putative c-di-GMP-specific phosphodiesterase class I)